MARVKRGVAAHRRHRKVLAQVKGHYSTNNRLYKRAHESMMRSLMYAYRDRRNRKRDMRRLWIIRINAAARLNGITYSRFIQGLHKAGWRSTARCLPTSRCEDAAAFSESPRSPSSTPATGLTSASRRDRSTALSAPADIIHSPRQPTRQADSLARSVPLRETGAGVCRGRHSGRSTTRSPPASPPNSSPCARISRSKRIPPIHWRRPGSHHVDARSSTT